jgi:hypothetical protein
MSERGGANRPRANRPGGDSGLRRGDAPAHGLLGRCRRRLRWLGRPRFGSRLRLSHGGLSALALGAAFLFPDMLSLLARRSPLLKRALALASGPILLSLLGGAALLALAAAPRAGRSLLGLLPLALLLLPAPLALGPLLLALCTLLLLALLGLAALLLPEALAALGAALGLSRGGRRLWRDGGLGPRRRGS